MGFGVSKSSRACHDAASLMNKSSEPNIPLGVEDTLYHRERERDREGARELLQLKVYCFHWGKLRGSWALWE